MNTVYPESPMQEMDGIADLIGQPKGRGRARLARELFSGVYRPGQVLKLREIGERYELGEDTLLNAFADFESLGVVKLSGSHSATVLLPSLKEAGCDDLAAGFGDPRGPSSLGKPASL